MSEMRYARAVLFGMLLGAACFAVGWLLRGL